MENAGGAEEGGVRAKGWRPWQDTHLLQASVQVRVLAVPGSQVLVSSE